MPMAPRWKETGAENLSKPNLRACIDATIKDRNSQQAQEIDETSEQSS